MVWLSTLPPASVVLAALAATTLSCAGIALFVWNGMMLRDRITQRVSVLCQSLVKPTTASRFLRDQRRSAMNLAGRALPKGDQLELARRLERLHVPVDRVVLAFNAIRLASALLMALVLALLAAQRGGTLGLLQMCGIVLVGGGLGWLIPHVALSRLVAKRMQAIEKGLPDAIELLVISVEAGLALEDAIDRVVPELRLTQPVLADELALTSADLKILPSRDIALRRLSERVTVASVHSVVTTLSQTMRYGTPLAQALRVVAEELRNDLLIRLEERANRMPVLLTVPMVVFILPSVFMIIGGPVALRLLDTFLR